MPLSLFPAEGRAIEQFAAEVTAFINEALRTPLSKPLYLMSRLEMMLFGMTVFSRQRRVFKYQSKTAAEVINGIFTDPRLKTVFHSITPLKRISMMGTAWQWNDFLSKKLHYPRGG